MKLDVLIVDDSNTMRKIMASIFEELGHRVIAEANNGRKAVEMYREFSPDLVTMDIQMPDINGVDAVKRIKNIDKKAKIIMITAQGQKETVLEAIKSGAKDYVLKPITKEKIKESLKKIAAKKE